jgi:peptidoglycan hydrolase-like protein with peptidoglycan-binding domain
MVSALNGFETALFTITLLASLEAKLQVLESEAGGSPSATPSAFTKNLKLHDTGSDVTQLQQYLIRANAGPAAQALKAHGTTKTFGLLTYRALIELQKKAGITPVSGYFGPITRAYVNARD